MLLSISTDWKVLREMDVHKWQTNPPLCQDILKLNQPPLDVIKRVTYCPLKKLEITMSESIDPVCVCVCVCMHVCACVHVCVCVCMCACVYL